MTTFNTGNPIGSSAAKDLYDNAENLDEFVNSDSKLSHPDRLGVERKTWHGMEQDFQASQAHRDSDFQAFLASSGYQFLGDYSAGIEITAYNQVIRDGGELWRLSAGTILPYTTTGAGMPEGGAFVSVGDAALRQELAGDPSIGQGGLLVNGAAIYFDTISELQAINTAGLEDKQKFDVSGTIFQYNSASNDFSPVNYVSVFGNGGDMFGASDCSAAIQSTLDEFGNAMVPQGALCRCDSMIEVGDGQSLYIQSGATLSRMSAHSASIDPVVWVKGSNAACFGDNRRTSIVRSDNRTPRGVLRLGHKDMTESHGNVTYSQLYNLALIGAASGGRTDAGEPDVCLYMPNPQFGGLASYFHSIDKLFLSQANIGMWMLGWANGNIIGDIQGYRLGNTTFGGPEDRSFIRVSGALDNHLNGAFFHQSSNSIGLVYEAWDNTANGGVLHTPTDSSFTGMIFEQGGASAQGLYATDNTGRSFFQFHDNVAGGNTLPEGFTDRNMVFTRSTSNRSIQDSARIQSERITIDQNRESQVSNEKGLGFFGLTEDQTYDLFTVSLNSSHDCAIVEVYLSYRNGLSLPSSVFKFVGMWNRGASNDYTFTTMEYSRGGTRGNICEPQNSNRTLTFRAHNNGTATSNGGISGFVRITRAGSSVSIPLELTPSAASGTPLTQT